MADYKAPLRDMRFVLNEVFDVATLWAQLPEPKPWQKQVLMP